MLLHFFFHPAAPIAILSQRRATPEMCRVLFLCYPRRLFYFFTQPQDSASRAVCSQELSGTLPAGSSPHRPARRCHPGTAGTGGTRPARAIAAAAIAGGTRLRTTSEAASGAQPRLRALQRWQRGAAPTAGAARAPLLRGRRGTRAGCGGTGRRWGPPGEIIRRMGAMGTNPTIPLPFFVFVFLFSPSKAPCREARTPRPHGQGEARLPPAGHPQPRSRGRARPAPAHAFPWPAAAAGDTARPRRAEAEAGANPADPVPHRPALRAAPRARSRRDPRRPASAPPSRKRRGRRGGLPLARPTAPSRLLGAARAAIGRGPLSVGEGESPRRSGCALPGRALLPGAAAAAGAAAGGAGMPAAGRRAAAALAVRRGAACGQAGERSR